MVLCAALGIVASYYWRVFYGWTPGALRRWPSPAFVWGWLCWRRGALLLRRVKDFAKRGTACILLCGTLFVFANPPMQTPDETDHYLRTYAISMGHFDFDAERGYPEDVNELVAAFPGAWVNTHTSAGVGTDPDTPRRAGLQHDRLCAEAIRQGRPGREHLGQLYAVSQLGKPRFCGRFRN